MLRISLLISALFLIMQSNNLVYAQTEVSVTATPSEKICAIGSTVSISLTGNYSANLVRGQESNPPNCQWKYISSTAYSDESCTTISTIVSATTSSDAEWATMSSYTKPISIKGRNVGTSWVKFLMKYRLNNTDEGTNVISITPVKIVVKNITLSAPRWLKKGDEGTIEITYDPDTFADGSIELSGLSDLYDIINSDFVEGTTNSATINPTDGKMSWELSGRTETKSGKIIVKIKGKNPKETKLAAKHSTSEAKAESDVGVFYVDIILNGIEEDKEESPGVFFAAKKRATLVIKAEPQSAGETATLSLTGLDLYNDETGGEKNSKRTWNIINENLPTCLYVSGTTSSSMKDKEAKLTWKSKSDTAKVTAVDVKVEVGDNGEEKNDKKVYRRYYNPIPTPQPDNCKTSIEFKYFPSDLNVGKLKPSVGNDAKLLDANNNEITLATEWDLTTETGRNATKTFTGIIKSISSNVVDVSLKHENTNAEDEAKIHLYQLELATNIK
ncbi:MAG: hypothetical protein LBE12_20575 [Planctomycetaceae bacterium]|jgi:hypothetical protein|nr:hypothetical protein [Planctomycetaceae bacterium]